MSRRKPSEVSDQDLVSGLNATSWDLKAAAERLNITPAQLHDNIRQQVPPHQSGLQSHGTLLNAIEDRIEGTARALGISKEEALALFAARKIPLRALIGVGGGVGATYALMSPGQAQAAPQAQAPGTTEARPDRQSVVDLLTERLLDDRARRGPR